MGIDLAHPIEKQRQTLPFKAGLLFISNQLPLSGNLQFRDRWPLHGGRSLLQCHLDSELRAAHPFTIWQQIISLARNFSAEFLRAWKSYDPARAEESKVAGGAQITWISISPPIQPRTARKVPCGQIWRRLKHGAFFQRELSLEPQKRPTLSLVAI